MDRIAAFNRTYTRLVRAEVARFNRDVAVEVKLGDKWGLVADGFLPLDERVLGDIFARCIDHAAKVEQARQRTITSLGVPMWATLARYDAAPCVAPERPIVRAPETCGKCAGSGVWHQKGAIGPDGRQVITQERCYACQGKGVQSDADQRRNWGYHSFYYRLGAA